MSPDPRVTTDSEKVTILNVDDYPPGLYARSRILRQAGFRVREATTGGEALQLAVAEKPDLVLLDVNLPDISGLEVCRRIKADPETASVLVLHLSATSVREGDRVRGLDFGADNYLIEPIEPEELIANVHALLRMRRAEQAARVAAREAHERRREAEVLADVARSVNASLDAGSVLRHVAAAARDLCRSDGAQVAVRDPASDAIVLRYGVRPDGIAHDLHQVVEAGQGVGGRVLATGGAVRTDAGDAAGAALAVPILIGTRIEGLLYVVNGPGRDFTERDADVLQRLADHAAIALRNSQLFAREQAARAEAEAANRAKDEFLATVSHELRTPLTAMVGWVRLLRSARLDDATRLRALDSIDRNARAQAQLIDDLLDVARIISGQLRLQPRPVELAAIVQAAVDAIRPAADAKPVRLEAVRELMPMLVSGDPDRLQQVVANLLSNAMKFTPAGGRVDVWLGWVGDALVLRISDTGQGISPDFLPHVFERFRQADSSVGRSHGGLGLGLAIVRQLVELHGGHIRAESAGEGHGATFTVTLPRLAAPAADHAPAAPSGSREPETPGRLDGVRILLVEDERDAQEVIGVILAQAGADVTAVGSAGEALIRLAEGRWDIIVSDIAMPESDGYALLAEVRRQPAERGGRVPAIALSAFARPDDEALSLAAGFQVHLRKPVRPEDLVATIRQLRHSRASLP
jgi:signal transduction histidine kinase